jgi:hypothetical protein
MGIRRGGAERYLFSEDDTPEPPLEQLTRHWVNERYAPDIYILPAQEELLGGLLDHLRVQVSYYSSSLLAYPGQRFD